MGRHASLPFHFYVYVENSFLGPDMPVGTTRAIWHGAHARPGQTLLCHLLLESGAHWSGMPLHALSASADFRLSREEVMPWAAMGERLEIAHFGYLEGLSCRILLPFEGKGRHTGLVFDWADGFSRYPEEHKPLNLIATDSGQFALLPNNFATYEDAHFVEDGAKDLLPRYRRGEEEFWGP